MIQVGSVVGNYEVLAKVGEGAMGSVFSAHHPRIGKKVALKVIHAELATNEEMLSRFFQEARAVTQIGHENIVEVQDYGQTPEGENFIVMELLEGIGLGDLIKKHGALSVPRATHIALQMSDGLAAAHARGIIHRDLKPDYVMLIPRGGDPDFVKILDFGLAKLVGPNAGGANSPKTATGSLLGTPHYMAPEQAESSKDVDQRADVYSLGCILFQLLTGRVPFPGEGFGDVLIKHIRDPPPLPSRLNPQVPKGIEKIVLHALAKKPDFRFANMEDFRRALRDPERFQQGMEDAELRLTPSEPMPAPQINRGGTPFDEAPLTIQAPRMAPTRLPNNAQTVQGEAPPQVQAAIDARRAAEQTRPATGGRSTVAQPHVALRKPKAKGGGVGLIIGLVAVVALGVGGFFGWRALRGEVTIEVKSDPDGVEVVDGIKRLGVSPLTVKVPRSATPRVLEFRKTGFLSAQRTVKLDADQSLIIRLLEKSTDDDDAPAKPTPVTVAVKPKPTPVVATPIVTAVAVKPTPIVAKPTPAVAKPTPVVAKPTPVTAPEVHHDNPPRKVVHVHETPKIKKPKKEEQPLLMSPTL